MEKISVKELVSLIEEAATAHPSVSQFGHGVNPQISKDGGARSVYVFLEFPLNYRAIRGEGKRYVREYTLPILFLDHGALSELDVLQIQSKCDFIAENTVAYLIEKEMDTKILSIPTYDTLTLENFHYDGWHGVRLELVIQTRLPINGCDVRGYFNG